MKIVMGQVFFVVVVGKMFLHTDIPYMYTMYSLKVRPLNVESNCLTN